MENNRRNDSSDLNADLFDSLVGEREDIYQQLFPVDRNSALIESRYKTEGEDEFYCS
jgi:phosphoketolase